MVCVFWTFNGKESVKFVDRKALRKKIHNLFIHELSFRYSRLLMMSDFALANVFTCLMKFKRGFVGEKFFLCKITKI